MSTSTSEGLELRRIREPRTHRPEAKQVNDRRVNATA